ncbi:MAG: ABC transporter ATP-binding protein [Clostridiaceae bacterium]|jgi:NitT/TauT family transport system ATP-binding protein|nr:ABC transporter ATP-binding protein [Clostridiaceae bacterium]
MDIVVSNISKSFGTKPVLVDYNAVFHEHQINCLMGPSGCGKTTLLNILMGFIRPDSGTVKGVPRHKSAVFQEDRLCESFNAVSNVRLVCTRKVNNSKIISHLEHIGLKGSLAQPVSELSGGMKRRVAIVRAILAQSDILFLDEPLKGLDEDTKKDVIQYIKAQIQGRTVIMVTHSIEEVKAFGGRLITMGGKDGNGA